MGQHHLNRSQRLGNQCGSFRCTSAGRGSLWLVDDILTTGATALAAAALMSGAARAETVTVFAAASLKNALDVLNKYKDEINGIFAVCEPNAAGVQKALKELGLAGKVKFVAFDPNEALVAGLADDSVDGIVLQDPVTMGYQAVKTMLKKLKNEPGVEDRVKTGEYVATPENRDTPEMKKLLVPEQFAE